MELRQINLQTSMELEQFLEPFHETAQMFVDSKQPHFQRVRLHIEGKIHKNFSTDFARMVCPTPCLPIAPIDGGIVRDMFRTRKIEQ